MSFQKYSMASVNSYQVYKVRFSMANTIVSSGPSGDLLHQEMVWIPGGSFRTGSDKHSTGYVMLAERPLR